MDNLQQKIDAICNQNGTNCKNKTQPGLIQNDDTNNNLLCSMRDIKM